MWVGTKTLNGTEQFHSILPTKMRNITTWNNGVEVFDVLQFFHGDGQAQEFEAGNSVVGIYCCVGCGVQCDRIDDIAYAYRCQQLCFQQRQDFLLQGEAWKRIKE